MATETLDVEKMMDRADRFASNIVKKIALDIHANVVSNPSEGGTPVDTGWARANWVPRVKEPLEEPVGTRPITKRSNINAKAIGDFGQRVFGGIDTSAQDAGVASVSGYRIVMGNVYVTNNVPYIGTLNAGSSRQAPAGFVERAIVKALVEDIKR